MFFFFLLFCFALVTCALIAVALQRFKSNWQSATDGHMSQHAANILSIMLFHYIIRCTSEDHILTKCNWWTRVSQHGGNIYSIILWFGIFPHCNISILFLIPIPCKAVKLSIVCIFELKSCTRVKTSQRMVVPIWVIAQLMHIKQLQNVFFSCKRFFDV